MRIFFALPLLMVAACSVERDAQNDQVTVGFNEQRLENAASDVGNAAAGAAAAIENEVGDLDVDVDVNRNEGGNQN